MRETAEVRPEEIIKDGLATLAIPATPEQVGAMVLHIDELMRWGRTHNLTALRDETEIAVKHMLDSCLYLAAIGVDVRSLADIGTGAGFPGVVIKIMRPEIEVYLIEPAKKKAAFLRHIIRRLNLSGITVINAKVSEATGITVDAAVTRALFSVPELIAEAGGIVAPGGAFILNKGPLYKDEIAGVECEVIDVELPHSGGMIRHIIKAGKP